ncbi:hypothetical protein GA0070622_0924 [Micromonospora sediminicola]|uniref:Uncharacterized protein n=1 Tax=Micromonospora sediminicola TaxID=946078 RepID=A0A1A9B4H1_9ACTN|nr:hypothetical protein [Micromonospora sediminicola]SBT63956.1 hypothetical protein GA0070622_0924 [Micromonospora sediminicola]
MSQIDKIDGGVNTARVSAAMADRIYRDQQQTDARRYLERTGNADLLPMLGLVEVAPTKRQPRKKTGGESS